MAHGGLFSAVKARKMAPERPRSWAAPLSRALRPLSDTAGPRFQTSVRAQTTGEAAQRRGLSLDLFTILLS